MRNNLFFYLLLLVLTAVDGWLLGHPNLIGRFGIFFYDYSYLDTVPKALLTVGGTVLAALALSWILGRLKHPVGFLATLALTVACLVAVLMTFQKFSSGTYQFTGSGFKTGAVLLPIILALVFGNAALGLSRKRKR